MFSFSKVRRSTWSPQRSGGVAGLGDLHLAQHLADDDLDVLVVDFHALEAVNFLHFVDQVLLERLRPAGHRGCRAEARGLR